MSLTLQIIDRPNDLEPLRSAWNRLDSGVVFRSFDWLTTWWQHYSREPREQLHVVVVRDLAQNAADNIVAIAPWYAESTRARGTVLRWLGGGEVCSDHLSVLCQANDVPRVAEHLAEHLAESDNWNRLDLEGVDDADPMMERLESELQSRGCKATRRPEGNCWAIELPATWDEFLMLQSKSHRKQLRRADNRVLLSDRAKWHCVSTQEELHELWPEFVYLHQRRRNSLGEPGCFASTRFASFHQEVASKLLDCGTLRLGFLELDGQAVAVEYQFAGSSTTYAYQAGLDPDRLEQGPGQLSSIAAIKSAIDQGNATFDFLRGDEPYKAHWRAKPRATYGLRVFARSHSTNWLAQTADWADSVASSMKASLRPLVAPNPTPH